MTGWQKLTRTQIAELVARDIPDGAYVNLGIGMPTTIAQHLPKDREIILHSENGIVGMDLAAGAKQVFVMMEHVYKNGAAKIVTECTYPLTGARVVDRIYTDLAIIDVPGDGRLVVRAMVEGMTLAELQAMTAAPLTGMDACAKIAA